jgi:hypothetical protein
MATLLEDDEPGGGDALFSSSEQEGGICGLTAMSMGSATREDKIPNSVFLDVEL